MFKRLTIKFFQSHRNSILNFSPFFNCIYGENCHGKTAIFRAIIWLKENKPIGLKNSWFSKGEPTEISILTGEDILIEFHKQKKTTYNITGYPTPFNPGRGSLKEVEEILNLGEMNIQRQLQPTFVITETPGKIAQRLNKVIQAEDVDSWVSEISKQIRDNDKKIKFLKNDRAELREQLRSIPDLKLVKDKIEKIHRLEDLLNKKEEKLGSLKKARKEYKGIIKDIGQMPLAKIKRKYEAMVKDAAILERYEELSNCLAEYKKIGNQLISLEEEKSMTRRDYNKFYRMLDVCPTCGSKLDEKKRKHLIKERGNGKDEK